MSYPYPITHTPAGQVTAYGFACGYVETIADEWKLYKDGCYHIRRNYGEWHTFGTLTEARKFARTLARMEAN